MDCTINLHTPEASCEGVSLETVDSSIKGNCITSETYVESELEIKS